MDSLFAFFFKYRPLLFAEGDVVFRGSWPLLLLLVAVAGGVAVAVTSYLRPR